MDVLGSLYNYSFLEFTTATKTKINDQYRIKCFNNVKNEISDDILSEE
jgi:hypothetical protein